MADGMLTDPNVMGQDVAAAQGVAPTSMMSTAENPKLQETFTQAIDPVKSTVAGQLTSLLSGDSAYIKEAERRGEQTANKRGMLNTSIAAGASTREAINAAMPIAQQDAGQYYSAGQNELNRQHEQIVQEKSQAFQHDEQAIMNAFNKNEAALNRGHQVNLEEMQNNFNLDMEEMRNTQESLITNLKLSADEAANVQMAANTIMANYQQNVVELLSDPTFLELSGADLNKTLDNMKNMAKNQVKFVGNLSQVDLTAYLDAAFPTYNY